MGIFSFFGKFQLFHPNLRFQILQIQELSRFDDFIRRYRGFQLLFSSNLILIPVNGTWYFVTLGLITDYIFNT